MSDVPAPKKSKTVITAAFLAGLAAGHGTSTLRQEMKAQAVYADAGPAFPLPPPPILLKQVAKAARVYGSH